MLDVAGWGEVEQSPVMEPNVRVMIDGVQHDPLSWSVDGEIGGTLPENVVGGSGITTATASLTFPRESADGVLVSPWEDRLWPPKRGARVQIWAGANGVEGLVFTGVVAEASGGTNSDLTVECRDDIDRLRRKVSFEPAMLYGPRLDLTSDRNVIRTGLLSTHYLGRAGAWCGYHPLPPRASDQAIFHADMNGALIPTRGWVTSSTRHGEDNIPLWAAAPWGMGTYNLLAEILPAGGSRRMSASRPLHMSLIKGRSATNTAANASMGCHWKDFEVRLTVAGGYDACFVTLISKTSGVTWRSANVPLYPDETVVAEFTTGAMCTIRTSGGRSWTGKLSWNSQMSSRDMEKIVISVQSEAAQVAALQVWMGKEWTPTSFVRSFDMDDSPSTGSLFGMGAIQSTALELIQEIAAAELSAVWFDPTGKLVLRNRRNMVEAAPVATKTSLDDLMAYNWSISDGGLRRQVSVKGTDVRLEYTGLPQLTVWQGSGDTIDGGTFQETLVEPGADEAWVAVDDDLWSLERGNQLAGYPSAFNAGRYSWSLATYADPKQGDNYRDPVQRMEKTGPQSWVITSSPVYDVVLKVPSEAQNYPLPAAKWRGENMPIVRAKGRIKFSDFSEDSMIVGPDWAEDYEHDGGRWIQRRGNARTLADFISRWTTQRIVMVSGVQLRPDPRIERGDVIILRDEHHFRREQKALVTGVHHSGTADKWEMSIDAQPISSEPLGVTYADQNAAWAGLSYSLETSAWSINDPNNYAEQSKHASRRYA